MYGNTIWEDIKWQFRYGGPLISLILINIAVFLLCGILGIVDWILKINLVVKCLDIFATHSSLTGFLHHPWGVITGMFLHADFMHILYNMLFLYWFGTIIQDYLGKSKILPIFLLGGIFSSLLSIPFYYLVNHYYPNFIPDEGIGASAGVMSIVLAAATLVPNNEISFILIGRVKIKWIALVYVLLDIISIPNNNAGGHIAHLGGALFGYIFIKQLQNGNDLSRPFYAVIDFFAGLFKKKSKMKVEYKKEYVYSSGKQNQGNSKQQSDKMSKQEKLDAILDKINRSSYDSLSKEEKEFLFKISQED